MSIDRSTREAVAFRQVFQAVVDRAPVVGDLDELRVQRLASGVAERWWRPRGWVAAFASAAIVAVAIGGVALVSRTGTAPPPVPAAPSVTGPFVVMDDPNSILGSDAQLTLKETGTVEPDSAFGDVQMRLWVREEASGFAEAVTLLEGDREAESMIVADLGGREGVTVEHNGQRFALIEAGDDRSLFGDAIALEWGDDAGGTRYLLIAQGFTREEALDMAATIAGQGGVAAGAVPERLSLEYEGPQVLTSPLGAVVRELVYMSEAGKVEVVSVDGWAYPEAAALLRSSDARRVQINDHPAVLAPVGILEWAVVWSDSGVTYGVTSRDLTPEQTIAAARLVRSVSSTEWDAIVAVPPTASQGEYEPTASSFSAVTEATAVGSGNGWSLFGQVVEKAQGQATAGNRGVCKWLKRDARTMIDLGCDFNTTGHPGYWPTFSTPDGVVMIGSMPIEASTVRVEIGGQEPIDVVPIQLGNETASALFVLEVPLTAGTARITIHDAAGNQLDADPQDERLHLDMPLGPAE